MPTFREEPGTRHEPEWWKNNYPEEPIETIHDVEWCAEDEHLEMVGSEFKVGFAMGGLATLVFVWLLWEIWHFLQ